MQYDFKIEQTGKVYSSVLTCSFHASFKYQSYCLFKLLTIFSWFQMGPDTFSGLCEGNHFLHEYILNYTRDFLRHPHPVKWAALDLNAGHRYANYYVKLLRVNHLSLNLTTLGTRVVRTPSLRKQKAQFSWGSEFCMQLKMIRLWVCMTKLLILNKFEYQKLDYGTFLRKQISLAFLGSNSSLTNSITWTR